MVGLVVASPKGDLVSVASFPGTPVPGSGFFRPFRDWFALKRGIDVRDLWSDERFVVRWDWNFAGSGKPATTFLKF